MIKLQRLFIYPIKSCAGIELKEAELVATGLRHDRQWMLVDQEGNFLSQRQHPSMALIRTQLSESELVCRSPNGTLILPLDAPAGASREVTIWNDRCRASTVSAEASRWFSDWLDTDCELVRLPADVARPVDPAYAQNDEIVSFADGFPLLVTSQSSMDLLNSKLDESLTIERFRPNIVLTGCQPHEEDDWDYIDIDGIRIDLVKPCSRCVIPSIDPVNASQHPRLNRTLAGYRRHDGKILFGMNGLHRHRGILRTGMAVTAGIRRPVIDG